MANQPVTIGRNVIDATRPSFVSIGGCQLSHDELNSWSIRVANWFRAEGLSTGDHIAYMVENRPEVAVIAWAAQRSGLYFTPIPTHLTADEAAYIASDSGARLIVGSAANVDMWRAIRPTLTQVEIWASVDSAPDFVALADAIADQPDLPTAPEAEGFAMLYSSGTTGRPKGIKRPISGMPFGSAILPAVYERFHAMGADTIYLSPAPLYHAAPLRAAMAVQSLGGTVVSQARFDPVGLLAAIEQYRATHVQLVPTMMRRLLDLPEDIRSRYDLSSLKRVIHAAAPCPVDLKRAMIDWLGPIVSEYYGGTEGVGMTYISTPEWLAHPGSVGRAISGQLHIVGDDGTDLPVGQNGLVYFAGGPEFQYHNAPEKLGEVSNARGWVTLGDIGHVDDEGYLTLVDRRSFVINSGGVNIYPVEVEAILRKHAAVADVAVIGVPDRDLGESVKAVVEPHQAPEDADAFATELILYCRARISAVKCPKSVDLVASLPRSDMGKVMKAELKQRYWRDS
jgi:long-chain acyl-CoA synthetase